MLKHVDLCSGIGGFALGFEWAGLSTPHLFCDIEPWCRDILKQHWPNVPIKSDVKELANDPDRFIPDCDVLTAGYPCQPFSSARERRTTATSGRTSAQSLHTKDPLGLFSKTLMATSVWGSTQCSLTWKPKATPQGRLLFQLAASVHRTEETESGLWATPRTTDVTGGPRQLDEKGYRVSKTNPNLKFGANLADQVKMWPTPRASEYKDCGPVGSKSHTHMYDRKYLCATVKMWPTPTATERSGVNPKTGKGAGLSKAVQMWPTPSASEHKAGLPGDKMQKMLGNHPEVRNSGTGTLNPTWVEWLMGYPKGWTELKD